MLQAGHQVHEEYVARAVRIASNARKCRCGFRVHRDHVEQAGAFWECFDACKEVEMSVMDRCHHRLLHVFNEFVEIVWAR